MSVPRVWFFGSRCRCGHDLDEGEVQMKRPQCALLAEACRLLGAVLALTSQGGRGWAGGVVPRAVFFRSPRGKTSTMFSTLLVGGGVIFEP